MQISVYTKERIATEESLWHIGVFFLSLQVKSLVEYGCDLKPLKYSLVEQMKSV